MKRLLRFLPLLLLLLAAGDSLRAQSESYDDVMLIVNTRSTASVEIGNFFASRRNIPESHICRIAVDTSETIDSARFVALKWEIQGWMRQRNLVDSMNYIVTTKGCPLRVSGSWDDVNTLVFGSQSSFEDCLVLMNGVDSVSMLLVKLNASFPTSRYYGSIVHFRRNAETLPMYLVTRLDGYTVEQVKSYITRAEEPAVVGEGLWVIDVDPGKDGSGGYQSYNDNMREGSRILSSRGMNVLFNDDATYLHNQTGVIGYASWGSNDGSSGGGAEAKPGNTWLNGSIAETAVSTGGRSFMVGAGYGQSLVADWIAEGACGMKGYTDEPYLFAIAHPDILFDRYSNGFNMAESFYAASRLIGWRQVVIGDPKMKLAVLLSFPALTQSIGSIDRYSVMNDTVWVRNISSAPVVVTGVRFTGSDSLDFTAVPLSGSFPATIPARDSLALRVSFRPVTYGSERTTMTVLHHRSSDSTTGLAGMNLTGIGLKPRLVAPTVVNFGLSGVSISRTMTLLNASPSDTITISRIYLSGADTTEFAIVPALSMPLRLLPGESRDLEIVYSPLAAEEGATARLNIVSNGIVATVRVDLIASDVASVAGESGASGIGGSIVSISPNPVVHTGRIVYQVARDAARVTLELFDMFGRRVALLADAPRAAGEYSAPIETDGLASGTYHCRLTVSGSEGVSVSGGSVVVTR